MLDPWHYWKWMVLFWLIFQASELLSWSFFRVKHFKCCHAIFLSMFATLPWLPKQSRVNIMSVFPSIVDCCGWRRWPAGAHEGFWMPCDWNAADFSRLLLPCRSVCSHVCMSEQHILCEGPYCLQWPFPPSEALASLCRVPSLHQVQKPQCRPCKKNMKNHRKHGAKGASAGVASSALVTGGQLGGHLTVMAAQGLTSRRRNEKA